jgi:hypothetical protein
VQSLKFPWMICSHHSRARGKAPRRGVAFILHSLLQRRIRNRKSRVSRPYVRACSIEMPPRVHAQERVARQRTRRRSKLRCARQLRPLHTPFALQQRLHRPFKALQSLLHLSLLFPAPHPQHLRSHAPKHLLCPPPGSPCPRRTHHDKLYRL